jgi:2-polyprenyl-6-methoxyphenol hydroxylase-like FAD-dependent oxidoreductase
MPPFRVIIVGGSVAGLTLSNMLEAYGIDFAVLEKHEDIAPRLGAGYAMMPYGARILDQLGCYHALEKLSSPVNSVSGFDERGKRCLHLSQLGAWMESRLVEL